MAESKWLQHALSVGVFEFRRSVRAIWQDKARFALMGLGVAIPSLMFGAFGVVFADVIRGIGVIAIPDQLRGMIALFWLFGVFLIGQRVVSARTHIEAESLMLTTVSARTIAGGLLIAETLRMLAYLGLPALVLTGVGLYLFSSPSILVVVPTVAVLFTATAVVTGTMVGYAAAWIVATSPFVARHKTVLGSALGLIGMGGYFLFLYPRIGGVDQAALAWFPMGWFADLAAIGTLLAGSSLHAAGVLLCSLLLLAVGGAVIEREAIALWFTDPVSAGTGDTTQTVEGMDGEASPSRGQGALTSAVRPLVVPRIVPTPARRVAEWALLRTRRDPNRLTFLMVPVFAIGSSLVSTGVQSGSAYALLAPLCAVVLPWLAGALFAMNPFGDEGAVLPVTLTAVSGIQYVRGLMVPGLVFGLPVVLVGTGIAGVVSPYAPVEQVGLVLLAIYLTCVAVVITPAIGMALPRFSAISVGQSREVLPSRMSAVIVHIVLTVLPGTILATLVVAPRITRAVLAGSFGFVPAAVLGLLAGSGGGPVATIAGWFGGIGRGMQAIGIARLQGIGGGTILIGGVVVAILLYRTAVIRFERYSPP